MERQDSVNKFEINCLQRNNLAIIKKREVIYEFDQSINYRCISDSDKVEKLNKEAFPEEERVPLSELLRYQTEKTPTFCFL